MNIFKKIFKESNNSIKSNILTDINIGNIRIFDDV